MSNHRYEPFGLGRNLQVSKKYLYQLFSNHGFISKDGHIKQVPLAYALMSQRRAIDYERVCMMYRYVLIIIQNLYYF